MRPKISKFERRIILAILLCAAAPFAISIVFIPHIIEARLALGMHPQVSRQLEDSVVFFKEFFDAKKKEYAARAETLARDPVLVRAAKEALREDIQERLQQVVEDNVEIRTITVTDASGRTVVRVEGPLERQGGGFIPKTIVFPLGMGDAPQLETTFILPTHYMDQRSHAEEIASLYATSMAIENRRSREFYLAYVVITAFVVLLTMTAGYFLARKDTRRIARLAQATQRVAKGETGFTIPIRGNDEITELSRRFNRMIEEVAEARDRIVYLEKVSGWQEFARRLAHEIKNPLTPIRLAIQELRQRAPDGNGAFRRLVEDATDVVEEEIGALTRLVDEFSQFARLPEVKTSVVEVGRFLEDFLSAYNGFEPDAVVDLTTPAEAVMAKLDRVLVRRVLFNLVTNAIQAAGPGKAHVWIRCRVLREVGTVELRVEDNGPGIAEADAERIFDPYYTTKPEGTGLGLAIVKKIILQHEGSIVLRPSTSGATFVISLPLLDRAEPDVGDASAIAAMTDSGVRSPPTEEA